MDVEDVVGKVDEILTPTKFNLADAIKGKAYPEDSVWVFLDDEAVYELHQLNGQLEGLSRHNNAEEIQDLYNQTEAQVQEVAQRVKDSGLKVTLRGRGHAVYDRISDGVDAEFEEGDTGRAHAENIRVVAASLVSIETNNNEIDDHEFTPDEVDALYEALSRTEWNKIMELLYSLAFANTYFDEAVKAGFLSRR